jgi:hypothetical protein
MTTIICIHTLQVNMIHSFCHLNDIKTPLPEICVHLPCGGLAGRYWGNQPPFSQPVQDCNNVKHIYKSKSAAR